MYIISCTSNLHEVKLDTCTIIILALSNRSRTANKIIILLNNNNSLLGVDIQFPVY